MFSRESSTSTWEKQTTARASRILVTGKLKIIKSCKECNRVSICNYFRPLDTVPGGRGDVQVQGDGVRQGRCRRGLGLHGGGGGLRLRLRVQEGECLLYSGLSIVEVMEVVS